MSCSLTVEYAIVLFVCGLMTAWTWASVTHKHDADQNVWCFVCKYLHFVSFMAAIIVHAISPFYIEQQRILSIVFILFIYIFHILGLIYTLQCDHASEHVIKSLANEWFVLIILLGALSFVALVLVCYVFMSLPVIDDIDVVVFAVTHVLNTIVSIFAIIMVTNARGRENPLACRVLQTILLIALISISLCSSYRKITTPLASTINLILLFCADTMYVLIRKYRLFKINNC
jgi:hypothetical protein